MQAIRALYARQACIIGQISLSQIGLFLTNLYGKWPFLANAGIMRMQYCASVLRSTAHMRMQLLPKEEGRSSIACIADGLAIRLTGS